MGAPSFIGYVGERDFHDGSILTIEQSNDLVKVCVRGASDKIYIAEFSQVCALRSNNPEGMRLYALSEMTGEPTFRRFVFVNWDENSTAELEIDAEIFRIYEDTVTR
jgi:hypothetical protein